MASTSARALTLLSVLSGGAALSGPELSQRLGVSSRTVRRDVEMLRGLGYAVETLSGPLGGYRLSGGARLPPLVFDEDQVIAIAVALQLAPTVLAGIEESRRRALTTVRQVMPDRLRLESDAFTVTVVPNQWEFPAPPIETAVVRAVGAAVRRRHVLRLDYVGDSGEPIPLRVEPHQLLVWAARWYLVAFDPVRAEWLPLRLDRIRAKEPSYVEFPERELPGGDAADFLRRSYDRGDAPAPWPCIGSAVLDVPPDIAARFAPGGAVVERVTDRSCRLTMGAWSWTGLAGLFITFAAELSEVAPPALTEAFEGVAERLGRIR